MKCENIKVKFPDFLTGDLEGEFQEQIKTHLVQCNSCRAELENLTAVWTKLGVLPEERPGEGLRSRFYSMLEDYKREAAEAERDPFGKRFLTGFNRLWPKLPAIQIAFSILFLAVGLVTGSFLMSGRTGNVEVAQLRQEIHDMRQSLVVSLLEQESSSERLRGVSMSSRMQEPDDRLLNVLLDTLNNDPNINVRLSAVDALYLFYRNPAVKAGLIGSLSQQTSPMVQMELIELMVNMRERQAVDSLRLLIQDERLDPAVKIRAEQGIQELIF